MVEVGAANMSTTTDSEQQRSPGQSFLRRLWYNRPVSDEDAFVREFRSHSFGFVLVATWTLAIVRTLVIAYQQTLGASPREPLLQAVTSGVLLYWVPPIVFWLRKDWARKYYHWVLDCFYAVYFVKVGLRVADGSPQLDDTNVLMLILIITSVIFLRIPFRHALVLTATSIAAIDVLALMQFGPAASFRMVFSTGFTLAMALYTSWGMEERDRGLFSKRLEAAAQAQEARRAAAEEQEQRIRAERAATEAFIASSEKQRLNDQLSTLYAQRELLIRGLHHDANQSLHVMGSALLTLRQKIHANPSFQSLQTDLDALALGTGALDGLIAGMYDLVKLGKYEPSYSPVPINTLLDNVAMKFSGAAAEKGLRFIIRRRQNEVFLWTDATAIERILANLVSNAVKYTIRGGVLVGTVKHGNVMRIDVWDTGVGIPKAQRNAIFGEFVRLEQAGVGDVKGLGLGLAIVKLFRDKLAGHYLEHSSTEGRGSRFSMSVPIAATPAAFTHPVEPSSDLATVGLTIDRLYVVIVEDNSAVQASIAGVLRAAGYDIETNVRFATCVAEAKAIFDRMPHRAPNLIVCDFRLRDGQTANEVIQLVDATFDWESVPVVIFSAEIEPAVDLRRPHTRVVVKTGNPLPLLREMESAVVAARR
ncbi:MAG: integral rane sensor hybrid histidine kinase [Gammaproteobacteria bacterium]|nr:integral rane sensor hybrid histidine kinase [Gammaproteobacteria bacterium]